MKERPILFNGDMVRAILEGRKTQTRRVMNIDLVNDADICKVDGMLSITDSYGDNHPPHRFCPYGQVGDRLWVRETWAQVFNGDYCKYPEDSCKPMCDGCNVEYRADTGNPYPGDWPADEAKGYNMAPKWKPSIHMPRWASRITLEITNIRVERLQYLSEEDAFSEGIDEEGESYLKAEHFMLGGSKIRGHSPAVFSYVDLWESINGKGSWHEKTFVWVIEFNVVKP